MYFHPFFGIVAMVAGVLAVPTLAYVLLGLFEGFPRIKLGQVAGVVAFAAWVFGLFASEGSHTIEVYLFLSVVGLLLIFFGLWKREMCLLMARRDDEFPGRWDKPGWFLLLTLAAPAGVWLFRSYRKAHWPEAGAAGRWAGATKPTRSSPWDEDEADALAAAGRDRVE